MSAIVIREIATGDEVRRMDVTGKSESQIERIERGLLMQMDSERFMFGIEGDDHDD